MPGQDWVQGTSVRLGGDAGAGVGLLGCCSAAAGGGDVEETGVEGTLLARVFSIGVGLVVGGLDLCIFILWVLDPGALDLRILCLWVLDLRILDLWVLVAFLKNCF